MQESVNLKPSERIASWFGYNNNNNNSGAPSASNTINNSSSPNPHYPLRTLPQHSGHVRLNAGTGRSPRAENCCAVTAAAIFFLGFLCPPLWMCGLWFGVNHSSATQKWAMASTVAFLVFCTAAIVAVVVWLVVTLLG